MGLAAKNAADVRSKYERLRAIFGTKDVRSENPAPSSAVASADSRAPRITSGEATPSSGGNSAPTVAPLAASQARRSAATDMPGANEATVLPGFATAMSSCWKYHSAWGIVGQSGHRPSVSRKSDADRARTRMAQPRPIRHGPWTRGSCGHPSCGPPCGCQRTTMRGGPADDAADHGGVGKTLGARLARTSSTASGAQATKGHQKSAGRSAARARRRGVRSQ